MNIIQQYIGKRSIHIYGCFLLFIGLFSCTEHIDNKKDIIRDGEVSVSFHVKSNPLITKATETPDRFIQDLYVLVFEEDNNNYYLSYKTIAERIDNNFTYEVTLKATDSRVKLYFVANVEEVTSVKAGYTIEQAKQKLIQIYGNEGIELIPMFGEVEYENLPSTETLPLQEVSLLRSVALTSVELDNLPELQNKFRLVSLQAYRANSLIQIIPDNWYTSNNNAISVSVPSIPSETQNKVSSEIIQVDENDNVTFLGGLYIPEAISYPQSEIQTQATCLIIGGIYGEGNDKVTYYRVDFEENGVGKNILRNHWYQIVIEDVKGPGASHPDEAAEESSVNISTQIIGWTLNDDSEINYGDGGKYFAIATRSIILPYYAGATETVEIQTNYEDYILFFEGEERSIGEQLETDYFLIENKKNALIVTTKFENKTGSSRFEEIYIKQEEHSRQLPIKINQQSMNAHERDYISIYSFTGTNGNLGDQILRPDYTVGGNVDDAIAWSLREFFLSSYFAPDGIIPFGGFSLSALTWESELTPQKADMYDVIMTPSNSTPVDPKVLYDWINYSARRVLLIFSHRQNILSKFGRISHLITPGVSRYKVPGDLPTIIKKGPFGDLTDKISEGLTAPAEDASSAYVLYRNQNPDLDPILVNQDNENEMVIALDRKNHILYLGDYFLFDTASEKHANTFFFSNSGEIRKIEGEDSTADIMLCNIITWIAETVIGESLAPDK